MRGPWLRCNLPFEGKLDNDAFVVCNASGGTLEWLGRYVKRPAPTERDYFFINPGDSAEWENRPQPLLRRSCILGVGHLRRLSRGPQRAAPPLPSSLQHRERCVGQHDLDAAESEPSDEQPVTAPSNSGGCDVNTGLEPPCAVEVRILWGGDLLHVEHRSPWRPYCVGEIDGVDYSIPRDKLGASAVPLILGGWNALALLLHGASGSIELAGRPAMTIDEAIRSGAAQPCAVVSGAHRIALESGTRVRMQLGDIGFEIACVDAANKAPPFAPLDRGTVISTIGSLSAHVGLLAAVAMFIPRLDHTAGDAPTDDQRYFIQQHLASLAANERAQHEWIATEHPSKTEGGTGTRAKGEEGSMGGASSKQTGSRYGFAGTANNFDPQLARQAALRDAAEFGMVGLLSAGAGGDPNAPIAPWGRDGSLGSDPWSARGNMWGEQIGEAFGGLGLGGIGEGGGSRAEGIGLGSIGTIGHGDGNGSGQGVGNGDGTGTGFGCACGNGDGSGWARLGGSHKPPRVRTGATSVAGRLPPEVIQRIVRQNFGRFRACYEDGLRRHPNLQGSMSVRFLIGRDGRIANVAGGGDLPDGGVQSCVTRAFYGLSFPQPAGGIVTVTYPITFTPPS